MMKNIEKNIITGYFATVWSYAINIVFIPVYIKYIGAEAYGIIGFYATLQTLMVFIDLGLQTTYSREVAQNRQNPQTLADLYATFSSYYWKGAFIVALILTLLAPVMAFHWFKAQQLSHTQLIVSFICLGISMAVRWPNGIYTGGLNGIQLNHLAYTNNVVFSTLRAGGALVVILVTNDKVVGFFVWQVLIGIVQVLSLRNVCRKQMLPAGLEGNASAGMLKRRAGFTVNIAFLNVLSFLVMGMDRIALSKMAHLSDLGYYAIATMFSALCYTVSAPIVQAFSPRLQTYVTQHEGRGRMLAEFHLAAKMITWLVVPLSVCLFLYSKEILGWWLHGSAISVSAAGIVPVLVIGVVMHISMQMPYYVQIAYGNINYVLIVNIVATILYIPLQFYFAKNYGAMGAAKGWVLLNIFYWGASIPYYFRRHLRDQFLRWVSTDIGFPILSATGCFALFFALFGGYHGHFALVGKVLVSFLLTAIVCLTTQRDVLRYFRMRLEGTSFRPAGRQGANSA